MALGFERSRGVSRSISTGLLARKDLISDDDRERIKKIKEAWNFYDGYHWEDIPATDAPELAINYCRAFVDKFVAFELGKAFTIRVHPDLEDIPSGENDPDAEPTKIVVTEDGRSLFQFLEDVWEDNDQYSLCTEFGQMKSVTGDAWLQVRYFSPEEIDDPFEEYSNGRIGILLHSTDTVFPKYDPHRKGVMTSLEIIYEYEDTSINILGRERVEKKIFQQIWTNTEVVTRQGKDEERQSNDLGFIPFVQIKNLPVAASNEGRGDLDDVIPLNVEYNTKSSNVSEIIDYHAAPITVVYGAKIGNLEKGANKVWGGLPRDSKVENLNMQTELTASTNYIRSLKTSMCEVVGIPETALGGAQSISNTSGVALQYINLPLIEKTRIKRMKTETALERLNKMIIRVALMNGLLTKPEGTEMRDFFWNEVTIPDTLPKDMLMELQQIQIEMKLGMESRKGGMRRLGKENVDKLVQEIDTDIQAYPTLYGINPLQEEPQMNSGMLNGQTMGEQANIALTGQNAGFGNNVGHP